MIGRNAESHFAVNPTRVDMTRSRFDRGSSHKTTFNAGDVVPFYVDEVLPGDTFSIDTSMIVRMQSLITPMMDNIYLDTYYFFVPSRLCWEHWRNLMGENTDSAWIPTTEYQVPQVTAPADGGWLQNTIADYMGVPTKIPGLSVNALPFRAYALICNEWFRDENLTDPMVIPLGDATVAGVNSGNYLTDVAKGGLCFKAAKYHDYFSAALPSPQKGADVQIPVAEASNLPVVPLNNQFVDSSAIASDARYHASFPGQSSPTTYSGFSFDSSGNQQPADGGSGGSSYRAPVIDNLWAVQSGNAAAATINQLRTAFQIQKLYERDARGGTRYIELLKSHFGVTSPDARLQRPEYLGGRRIPINVNQIVQTSATETSGTPQGNVTGLSVTNDVHSDFTKSFVEHGFVIGVMVARYPHTYQQGLERMWSRKTRFDYYWPVFANIGEQAILNKEIYAQGTAADDEVFGYQEAWADYRYKPSRVSGEMRSNAQTSLDIWHLADDYSSLPALSDSWIREDSATVDRVLAVSERVSNQFFADIYVRNRCTRCMPLYSVPGLIDHH